MVRTGGVVHWRRHFRIVVALAITFGSTRAFADDEAPKPEEPKPEESKPEVGFSSDELEGDLRLGELTLRGNVVVTYGRFRLTSPELRLARTNRGIAVHGWGEVVFCPCPDPPVSVGFRGGLVAPPADLLLDRPELRIAGTTILVLPWFWLRSPIRPGLLPPLVAFRGSEGLLVGGGVHFPWFGATDPTSLGAGGLDLTGAGYLQGGFELTARLQTSRSTNRARWDRLHGDFVAVDAHGSYPQADTAAVAWDVDVVRGARGRSAAQTLDEAARAYDRLAAETSVRPASAAIVGLGVRGVGARGGSGFRDRAVGGPRAALALGGAAGALGAWDALAGFGVLHDPTLGPIEIGRIEGGLDVGIRPSIFLARLGIREWATAVAAPSTSAVDGFAAAELELASPLGRTFDSDDGPVVHIIEPRARISASTSHTSGGFWSATGRPIALGAGGATIGSLGLRSSWGRPLGRSGGALEADVGAVSALDETRFSDATVVVRYRTSWSARYLGWWGEGASRLQSRRSHVMVGRVRVGEEDGWQVGAHVAGRAGIEPILARALAPTSAREPSGGWLSDEGWSGGAEVRARFGRPIVAKFAVDDDLTAGVLLSARGSVGYAHPCRCMAFEVLAGHRLGRGGVDVSMSIDLAPR